MLVTLRLSRLLEWLGHEDRRDHFLAVFDQHFATVYEDYGVTLEDIERLVGPDGMMPLMSCVLEDFLSQTSKPECPKIVDDYLRRRGWKESAATRQYIEAVRTSCMSLYEVTDVVPGRYLQVRDLLRNGEPIRVSESSPKRGYLIGDRIAARPITVAGKTILADGLLPFQPETAEEYIVQFHAAAERALEAFSRMIPAATAAGIPYRADLHSKEAFLASCAGTMTGAWVTSVVRSSA